MATGLEVFSKDHESQLRRHAVQGRQAIQWRHAPITGHIFMQVNNNDIFEDNDKWRSINCNRDIKDDETSQEVQHCKTEEG
jgi:hypothetical protein